MLAMQFGQTWNGTMDAYANDGSALTGTISLEDSVNGGAPQTYCTLPVSAGGACGPNVGTTTGTAVGTHVLTAVYSGDTTHQASTSASVTIVVSQETTTAALTDTPNPALAGQPVVLTATVSGSYASPAGAVTFMYGGSVIGTANLAAGTGVTSAASISTSTLPVGQDTITAVYASSADFSSATAMAVATITPPPPLSFTLSVTPLQTNVSIGLGATLNVAVTPANGFAQDVSLSCANLPAEASCQFTDPTIAGGNGTTTLVVQTTAPHTCGTATAYLPGKNWMIDGMKRSAGIAIAGILLGFVPMWRRARLRLLLVASAVLAAASQLSGCGCTDLGTRPAVYTIEVTATPSGSGVSAVSQAVKINVTI